MGISRFQHPPPKCRFFMVTGPILPTWADLDLCKTASQVHSQRWDFQKMNQHGQISVLTAAGLIWTHRSRVIFIFLSKKYKYVRAGLVTNCSPVVINNITFREESSLYKSYYGRLTSERWPGGHRLHPGWDFLDFKIFPKCRFVHAHGPDSAHVGGSWPVQSSFANA